MGEYSRLTIGEVIFTWKYEVPSFLTFVVDESDLFIKREDPLPPLPGEEPPEIDPDELFIEEAGFRTTVGKAKAVLDRYGYTPEFFAEVYGSFQSGLEETAKEVLGDEFSDEKTPEEEVDARVRRHLAASGHSSLGDLEAFTTFLRRALETNFEVEPFIEDVRFGQKPERQTTAREWIRFRQTILADFESMQMLLVDRARLVSADVLRPFILFSEGYVGAFPEVISLMYTRLVLDATPDDAVVELDVHEIVETESQLRSLHSDLAYELLHKVDVYERVFRALSEPRGGRPRPLRSYAGPKRTSWSGRGRRPTGQRGGLGVANGSCIFASTTASRGGEQIQHRR
jgi:hypothetical protein